MVRSPTRSKVYSRQYNPYVLHYGEAFLKRKKLCIIDYIICDIWEMEFMLNSVNGLWFYLDKWRMSLFDSSMHHYDYGNSPSYHPHTLDFYRRYHYHPLDKFSHLDTYKYLPTFHQDLQPRFLNNNIWIKIGFRINNWDKKIRINTGVKNIFLPILYTFANTISITIFSSRAISTSQTL